MDPVSAALPQIFEDFCCNSAKDGEVTFKKFETTELMGSIQIGIQQSVGNFAGKEERARDLLEKDFRRCDTVVFSR